MKAIPQMWRLRALDLLIVNRLGRARTSHVRHKRHFIRGRRVRTRATHGRITVIATAGNANSLMRRFHARMPHRWFRTLLRIV